MSTSFDPNSWAVKNGAFLGLPWTPEESSLILFPISWDVTTSYRPGTSKGPEAIREASYQIDLQHRLHPRAWEIRAASHPESTEVLRKNRELREMAEAILTRLAEGHDPATDAVLRQDIEHVDEGCKRVLQGASQEIESYLQQGKRVLTIGGDHSVTLAPLWALTRQNPGEKFSILHIDAHADLRPAYEGFTHSHASIMHEALKFPELETLVQVGIRDLSSEERNRTQADSRIHTLFDWEWKRTLSEGRGTIDLIRSTLSKLGSRVYVSIDIDGLDPKLCPGTGTPVPGGLEFSDLSLILEELLRSGRTLIGGDVLEVAPEGDCSPRDFGKDWNANVGARTVFELLVALDLSKPI
jgi:agmatinase